MKKITILHAVTIMDRGGLETFIMNIYRNIDRNKFNFIFLVQRDKKGLFDDEIEKLGGKIYHIPPFNPFHHIKYLKAIDTFFKEHHNEIDIVHAHNNAQAMYILRAAKKYNIQTRISHSHLAGFSLNYKIPFFVYARWKLKKYCNVKLACGNDAGKWLFKSNDFTVFPNAINLDKFNYNEDYRNEIRKKYNIGDEIVIGHVGRFNKAKNHIFMIRLLEDLVKRGDNVKLLLVGSGESEEEKIKKIVEEKHLDNNVIFAGSQSEVFKYLDAMDVFLFPSILEGFPVTLIEAQANGIQCVVSDKVPQECKITDLITFLNLQDSVENWEDVIIQKSKIGRKNELEKIKLAGFEIKSATKKIEKMYEELYEKSIIT